MRTSMYIFSYFSNFLTRNKVCNLVLMHRVRSDKFLKLREFMLHRCTLGDDDEERRRLNPWTVYELQQLMPNLSELLWDVCQGSPRQSKWYWDSLRQLTLNTVWHDEMEAWIPQRPLTLTKFDYPVRLKFR